MQETHSNDLSNYGAGILLICPPTRRILLGLRSSKNNSEPNKWCCYGGHLKNKENPINGAKRELLEEAELFCSKTIETPLYINKKEDFTYYNFIGLVNCEITPTLNDEHSDYNWYRFSELSLLNLHSGIVKLLENSKIKQIILNYLYDPNYKKIFNESITKENFKTYMDKQRNEIEEFVSKNYSPEYKSKQELEIEWIKKNAERFRKNYYHN